MPYIVPITEDNFKARFNDLYWDSKQTPFMDCNNAHRNYIVITLLYKAKFDVNAFFYDIDVFTNFVEMLCLVSKRFMHYLDCKQTPNVKVTLVGKLPTNIKAEFDEINSRSMDLIGRDIINYTCLNYTGKAELHNFVVTDNKRYWVQGIGADKYMAECCCNGVDKANELCMYNKAVCSKVNDKKSLY